MPAVNCPNCRDELDIPSEFVGRDVRCAVCQTVFTVPYRAAPPVVQRRSSSQVNAEASENNSLDDETTPRRKKARGSFAWLFIMLGMLSCCGVGCGGFGILIAIVANPPFQPYTAPDETFSAVFPGKVTATKDTTDDGLARFRAEARRKFPPEFYWVQHVELTKKEDADTILKVAADRSVKRISGGTEVKRTPNTIDGYSALDVTIEHGNGQQVTLVRHIVVGKRLYSIGIDGPQGLDFVIDYVDKFFSGFQLKSKAPEAAKK
jgi:LSD1 subclass zinc finger protein